MLVISSSSSIPQLVPFLTLRDPRIQWMVYCLDVEKARSLINEKKLECRVVTRSYKDLIEEVLKWMMEVTETQIN